MELNSRVIDPVDTAIPGLKEETESDLAKSNFLARMSHEMRTPLNAIIGMSTIAQTCSDPEKIARCLLKINEASIHLLSMINDILDMAKIEVGSLKLINAEFDLPHMIQKTCEMAKFMLDAKKQDLKLDIDPALPETIIADEQRLSQVLDNLLSNAIKFTPPEGTIILSVKKIKEDEKTCTLKIEVTDTGIGMSEEVLKTVLTTLFEQADGSTSRKYGGVGLGLPISVSIVRLMGGNIRVGSEPRKGSVFGFEVTVELGSRKAEKSPDNTAGEQNQKQKFAGHSILIVEDVEINREIVLALLEDSGMVIDCAENGLQALEMYKANPGKYSLILMDIHMPEMDGLEATQRIRAYEAELHAASTAGKDPASALVNRVPIIAMTANVFKDDVQKCFEAGMTGHLGKPIDFEELMKELDRHLTQP